MFGVEHVRQTALLGLEAVGVSVLLLSLFRMRSQWGLSPLYITLGTFQHMQAFLASSLYVDVFPGVMVSPGSSVLFVGSLFAALLVYIREDAAEARKLIYGLVVANFALSLLTLLFRLHLASPLSHNLFNLPQELFVQDFRVMAVGTVALVADVIAIIILFEALSRLTGRFVYLRIYLSLASVLALDTAFFVTCSFYDNPLYEQMLVSGLVGKSLTALFFAAILTAYLRFFERFEFALPREDAEISDIFKVLTYRQRYEALRKRLTLDPLTGIFNRRFFDEFLPGELERSHKLGLPASLLMIDVDEFKKINDRHGHPQGDRILQTVAKTLKEGVRSSDAACRYGGDEFVIVMPDADNLAARRLADCLRARLDERFQALEETAPGASATVTIGIATFPTGAVTAGQLVDLADQRLYAGKQAGRDCVVDAHGDVLARARWTKSGSAKSEIPSDLRARAGPPGAPKLSGRAACQEAKRV